MLKRLSTYIAILLGRACMIFGYVSFENWRFRQAALKELGPILADEQDQKNELLALGDVDLNPTGLTLATLELRLKRAVLKRSGDFNSRRLGWACGKERCAIWATFLVPLGQDIQPNAAPAGLIIKSPALGDFPSITIREIRLGESDQKLVELWKAAEQDPRSSFVGFHGTKIGPPPGQV